MDNIKEMKSKLSRLENYTFSDLCDIIGVLRSPEGCPWDREQDHESIRKNFIEETYEVIEAIDDSDTAHLSEELGDVMLQILLHAEMEKEKNNFDIYDVINGISKKLIRRHPHVFGKVSADTPDEVKKNWDAIKREEKGQNNLKEELEGISRTLPSLMRAQKILKKAKKAGVDICRENDAFDSLDADGFADVLMRLCGAANNKGIDLEEIFDKKCTFEVQNSKNL